MEREPKGLPPSQARSRRAPLDAPTCWTRLIILYGPDFFFSRLVRFIKFNSYWGCLKDLPVPRNNLSRVKDPSGLRCLRLDGAAEWTEPRGSALSSHLAGLALTLTRVLAGGYHPPQPRAHSTGAEGLGFLVYLFLSPLQLPNLAP